jgi:site-specific DNA-methyltransferase (cytosine-N4-specific)
MPAEKESRIPVGSQFTPRLISLHHFLKALVASSGDQRALQDAIWRPEVRVSPPKKPPTRRQRNLPLEAAVQYGLIEKGTYNATALTVELERLSGAALSERFARDILLNRGGLRVVEGIQQMEADELKVTGDSLARFLTAQGFRVVEHNTAINTLRLWLAEAGLFPKGRGNPWKVNSAVKQQLLNLDDKQIMVLASLSKEQAAFVEGLCAIEPDGWIAASDVRDWAETCKNVRIGRGSLPKEVLDALQSADLIEYRTKGTGGGKTSTLRTTEKFDREVLGPFVTNAIRDLDASVSAYYRQRPEDIFRGLTSKDKHEKGQALEAFAIFVMRLLGLRFVGWRKRAHAEVDAVMEGVLGPVATRWQIQCKNTPSGTVGLEDVAKEVGLVPVTRATHILFIANSRFSSDAIKYAQEVMKNASVHLFLLDRDDFEQLRSSPASIGTILRKKAEGILDSARPPFFESSS